MQRNCSSLTRASEIMVLHFFQQIMCYFLPNYVQKSWIMHKLQKIFKQKFSFFSMHWACKSSLVLLLIQNYPFSKQNTGKKVLPPNKSHQGAFFFSKLWSVILIFFQSWQVLYKKLEHICEHFLQHSGGYFLQKCTMFTRKKFPSNSQGSLSIDLTKYSKSFFFNYANYVISHLRIILEALPN